MDIKSVILLCIIAAMSSTCLMDDASVLHRARVDMNADIDTAANVAIIQNIVSETDWDYLFPIRNPQYTYESFLQGAAFWPEFCSDALLCADELAVVFAHNVQETGLHTEWGQSVPLWRQGLVHLEEFDQSSAWTYSHWDNAMYPPQDGVLYFGRGAKQLTHNYNYGPYSLLMTGDKMTFLNNPDMVAEQRYAFSSAIWFLMTPQNPKPSMHDVITGCWQPNTADIAEGRTLDTKARMFALTTHIINGGLECNIATPQAYNRFKWYLEMSNYLNVPQRPTSLSDYVECANIQSFNAQSSAANMLMFYDQDWANTPCGCKLVSWDSGYFRTIDMLGECEMDKCGAVGTSKCSSIGTEHGWANRLTVNNCDGDIPSDGPTDIPSDDPTPSQSEDAAACSTCLDGGDTCYIPTWAVPCGVKYEWYPTNSEATCNTQADSAVWCGTPSNPVFASTTTTSSAAPVNPGVPSTPVTLTEIPKEQVRICYFQNWFKYRPTFNDKDVFEHDLDPTLCTHIQYGFLRIVDNTWELTAFDPWADHVMGTRDTPCPKECVPGYIGGNCAAPCDPTRSRRGFDGFLRMKEQNPNLKLMVSVGGWNYNDCGKTDQENTGVHSCHIFSTIASSETNSRAHALKVIEFLRMWGFDGYDVDWEYPVAAGHNGGDQAKPNDYANYIRMLRILREEFEKEALNTGNERLLLTAAVGVGKPTVDESYDVPQMNIYLDMISLMTYDMYGAWDPSQTGFNSPLYPAQEDLDLGYGPSVQWAVDYYIQKGASPDKLVLGMGTYGRGWKLANPGLNQGALSAANGPSSKGPITASEGYLSYTEIEQLIQTQGATRYWDDERKVPYVITTTGEWIGYDDAESFTLKTNFLMSRGLRGAMWWALELDDAFGTYNNGQRFPLINTVKTLLSGYGPASGPVQTTTTVPSVNPTLNPTDGPTMPPSSNPSLSPTREPTQEPSLNPTNTPSLNPSLSPTGESPTLTQEPSLNPTNNPSLNPSLSPTREPTQEPSLNPTNNPSLNPTTNGPTTTPTVNPTLSPTRVPTTVITWEFDFWATGTDANHVEITAEELYQCDANSCQVDVQCFAAAQKCWLNIKFGDEQAAMNAAIFTEMDIFPMDASQITKVHPSGTKPSIDEQELASNSVISFGCAALFGLSVIFTI